MTIQLPKTIVFALETLNNAGFEAFCVGGAIRDHLLGKTPYDYDITTNALPEDIISLFNKTVPTGIKHGTVTVILDDYSIEITTYRTDGEYLNNRSPENVNFVSSVDEDVNRRDFTVNSILYHPVIGFLDPVNGVEDLKNKIIRAVGDPETRFKEDALRILRAFRFSSQLGFNIEGETLNYALKLTPLLSSISKERVFVELKKIFLSEYPNLSEYLFKTDALSFCGISNCSTLKISHLPFDFPLRFAFFCRSYGIDPAISLKSLKSDNHTLKSTENLYLLLQQPVPKNKIEIKYLLKEYGVDTFSVFCSAKELYFKTNPLLLEQFEEILINNEPYTIGQLAISGDDLKAAGLCGKKIGETLNQLLNKVILDPQLNTKDKLLRFI